ncbi:MAG: S41 family peptidase [Rhodospirillaceae bacterium]|jgi:carboxyl-terminal processing protease|nr:S41 family peptidase [Rhodospirillaceae bacterium]MBT3629390.1 S41 family peptidase [Rhodospirillaceae bacterium]MBT3927232.1 S41 family peptidase [Rhodospirillaceae bacterium]MBT4426351.1 S41 family peptidase [Rhodospirillaceae bacterium]MBT5038885.1 S41 family peptidase [Rhodospirillaceae bacterium]
MHSRLLAGLTGLVLFVFPLTLHAENNETYRQLNLFGDVFERVRADYVEEVSDTELIEAAINGMLSSLDPHSRYLNAKSFQDMQTQTRGEFGGLGIEVTMDSNGFVKVITPIDDTPAQRAGLQPGDFVTHLDGEPILGLTLAEAVEKMRGPIDSGIVLTIQRPGAEAPMDVEIIRAVITIRSVRTHMEGDDVAYVRISSFSEKTTRELEAAVEKYYEEYGETLKGLVLDLRNNPGGLLDQAVSVSDSFLIQGEIVSTRGRRADSIQRFNAKSGDLIDGMPMIVLINGGSASASEIVAGALQDHHRAIILGTRSFGKASVQTVIPLGGHGAMRLTTARYYTPSGTSIQARGIHPDIAVEQAKVERVNQGRRRSEADLRGSLTNEQDDKQGDAADAPAEGEAKKTEPAAEKSDKSTAQDDYQLARALDLLRGLQLLSSTVVN